MARASVSEYGGFVHTAGGITGGVREPALVEQQITFTTSTQSSAFGPNTRLVRVEADADAFIKFGENPTASAATSKRLPAGVVEYFFVQPGHKVAFSTS